MNITAKVKAGSKIDRHWRTTRQLAGQLAHTLFRLTPDGYVAETVDSQNISALMLNPSVQVEIYTAPVIVTEKTEPEEPNVSIETEPLPQVAKRAYTKRKGGN